jgi:hypothetical protein
MLLVQYELVDQVALEAPPVRKRKKTQEKGLKIIKDIQGRFDKS